MSKSASPPKPLRGENRNDTLWLLRRVWDRVNKDNEHFMAVIVGREGSGKSYSAIKLADMLDDSFSADRIIFNVADLLEELRDETHDPGNFYVLDEAGVQFGIRTWQDRAQVLANQALQLIRDHNLGLIFTLPRLSELDTQAQGRLQALLEVTEKQVDEYVRIKWKWMDPDRTDDTGKIYKPYPRRRKGGQLRRVTSIGLTPPKNEELVDAYETNKGKFQEEFYDETISKLKGEDGGGDNGEEEDEMGPREIAEEIKSNGSVEKYTDKHSQNKQPFINDDLIREDYDLSIRDARTVKRHLNNDFDTNELAQYA